MILCLLSFIAFPATAGQFFGIETGYYNTCLWEKEGLNREGPQEFDCPRFVIESTDQIWNMYRGKKVDISTVRCSCSTGPPTHPVIHPIHPYDPTHL